MNKTIKNIFQFLFIFYKVVFWYILFFTLIFLPLIIEYFIQDKSSLTVCTLWRLLWLITIPAATYMIFNAFNLLIEYERDKQGHPSLKKQN